MTTTSECGHCGVRAYPVADCAVMLTCGRTGCPSVRPEFPSRIGALGEPNVIPHLGPRIGEWERYGAAVMFPSDPKVLWKCGYFKCGCRFMVDADIQIDVCPDHRQGVREYDLR